ncbi:MAG: ExsB family protein, queuosine biosynthesis protein QueC [Thaumarchaeota archaeon CSP1-1]|nr:MAG: ExsB family protein, queuosine biosynthesis protein QueC [Thaumarchaeota archaeon CSP1-1]
MKKAVVVFSGGIDSVCTCAYLKSKYDLYGISFSYGQRANKEMKIAKTFSKILGLKEHKIIDISFMKNLYGETNVLTSSKNMIPHKFDYSIVVPIRNAIFLSIATAWAFTLNASLIAYGAHKGDKNYPDCRPSFSKKIEQALNEGELDGIKLGIRKKIVIWSPFREGLTKSELLKKGFRVLGDKIFNTWSCYDNKKLHCGTCESCNNRKAAFIKAKLHDKTKYLS